MAKIVSPLMGIKAQGKLGNSLVYAGWKGVQYVKTKVDPTDPNSTDQQAERTLYGECIEAYRDYPLSDYDKAAWRRFQKILRSLGTEYNTYVKMCLTCKIAGYDWRPTHNAEETELSADTAEFRIYGPQIVNLNLWLSTNPYLLESKGNFFYSSGSWSKNLSGLVDGETYYWQCKGSGFYHSGIYKYKFESP